MIDVYFKNYGDNMQFYYFNVITNNLESLVSQYAERIIFPCVILQKDKLNDFGKYHTTFRVSGFKAADRGKYFGKAKIMHLSEYSTTLPKKFTSLENSFFSIGQETVYYLRLFEFFQEELAVNALEGINDVLFTNKDIGILQDNEIFHESLLRFSEAKVLWKRRKAGVLQDVRIEKGSTEAYGEDSCKILFEASIPGALSVHKIEFDFTPQVYLPYRLQVIIGKNGTGKSRILSSISNVLAGKRVKKEHGRFCVLKDGEYQEQIPDFRKIITIAYSPFDNYPESNLFNYIHRSFSVLKDTGNLEYLKKTLKNEYDLIVERHREKILMDVLGSVINFDDNVYEEWIALFLRDPFIGSIYGQFSSGQIFSIIMFIDLIANIENESLILLDEPDLYLHPNAINALVRNIYLVLDRFNSYGIITTHSAYVLQNIPSSYVNVFRRQKGAEPVYKLRNQCFGASISAISKEIFNIDEKNKYYISYLKKIGANLTREEASDLFDNNLSFGAGVYLETMISARLEGENEKHK